MTPEELVDALDEVQDAVLALEGYLRLHPSNYPMRLRLGALKQHRRELWDRAGEAGVPLVR